MQTCFSWLPEFLPNLLKKQKSPDQQVEALQKLTNLTVIQSAAKHLAGNH